MFQLKKEQLLSSPDVAIVTDVLLEIAFSSDDWRWVQGVCLKLLDHPDKNVSGLAITCLGHVARIHSAIDRRKVVPILTRIQESKSPLAGRASDALDDIEMFVA